MNRLRAFDGPEVYEHGIERRNGAVPPGQVPPAGLVQHLSHDSRSLRLHVFCGMEIGGQFFSIQLTFDEQFG